MPKYSSDAALRYLPTTSLDSTTAGTRCTANPIITEMTVIKLKDATDPKKLSILPYLIANNAAMKNVLSPISDANIKLRDAKNPDFASTDVVKNSLQLYRNV